MTRSDRPSSQVSPTDAAAQSPQPATFEEGLAQLSELVGRLEGGQLGLAESIAAYERGVTLVRALHGELSDVEQRVRLLTSAPPQRQTRDGDRGEPSPPVDADWRFDEGIENPPGAGEEASGQGQAGTRRRAAGGSPKRGAKGGGGRSSRPADGRPQRLPGMDDPSAEV